MITKIPSHVFRLGIFVDPPLSLGIGLRRAALEGMRSGEMVMHPDEIKDRLRKAGCRATSPRIAILSLLMDDETHPAIDDVYHRIRQDLPGISLSTVYETIDKFVELGLCQRVEGPGQPARVDAKTHTHAHARCMQCGKIIDLDEKRFPPPIIPGKLVEGFKLKSAQLMYEGTCAFCQVKAPLDWSV